MRADNGKKAERALLVGIATGPGGRARTESSVEELGLLAKSAGAHVVGQLIQERPRKDPATLIGRGKVEDVARVSEEKRADLLVFDDELSPAQQRNLEQAVGRKTWTARSSSSTSSRAARGPARAGCRSSWRSSTTCCRG